MRCQLQKHVQASEEFKNARFRSLCFDCVLTALWSQVPRSVLGMRLLVQIISGSRSQLFPSFDVIVKLSLRSSQAKSTIYM
jgi:hypothetical protein